MSNVCHKRVVAISRPFKRSPWPDDANANIACLVDVSIDSWWTRCITITLQAAVVSVSDYRKRYITISNGEACCWCVLHQTGVHAVRRDVISLTNRKRIISELGYYDTFPGFKCLQEKPARLSVTLAYVKNKRQSISEYHMECCIHVCCRPTPKGSQTSQYTFRGTTAWLQPAILSSWYCGRASNNQAV